MVTCTLKGGSRDNEVNEGMSGSSQKSQILERMNEDATEGKIAGPLINSQTNGCKPLPFVSRDFHLPSFCFSKVPI